MSVGKNNRSDDSEINIKFSCLSNLLIVCNISGLKGPRFDSDIFFALRQDYVEPCIHGCHAIQILGAKPRLYFYFSYCYF